MISLPSFRIYITALVLRFLSRFQAPSRFAINLPAAASPGGKVIFEVTAKCGLDELISNNEEGMRFQAPAVVLAKQKRLVLTASERCSLGVAPVVYHPDGCPRHTVKGRGSPAEAKPTPRSGQRDGGQSRLIRVFGIVL